MATWCPTCTSVCLTGDSWRSTSQRVLRSWSSPPLQSPWRPTCTGTVASGPPRERCLGQEPTGAGIWTKWVTVSLIVQVKFPLRDNKVYQIISYHQMSSRGDLTKNTTWFWPLLLILLNTRPVPPMHLPSSLSFNCIFFVWRDFKAWFDLIVPVKCLIFAPWRWLTRTRGPMSRETTGTRRSPRSKWPWPVSALHVI